jgi:hypothetical protein
MASRQHDRASQPLDPTLREQDGMGGRSKPAMGTSSERGAYSLLWAAVDRVAAGQAWLHWIDEAGSRGLNARPFKMLAEGWFDRPSTPAGPTKRM